MFLDLTNELHASAVLQSTLKMFLELFPAWASSRLREQKNVLGPFRANGSTNRGQPGILEIPGASPVVIRGESKNIPGLKGLHPCGFRSRLASLVMVGSVRQLWGNHHTGISGLCAPYPSARERTVVWTRELANQNREGSKHVGATSRLSSDAIDSGQF